jgi:hypothetical protein
MRVLALLLLIVLPLSLTSCLPNTGKFSIMNKSTETITDVSVTICHQTYKFKTLQPAASITQSYEVTGDSNFTVSAQTQSGNTITASDGYVTNGMDFRHEIIVDQQSIKVVAQP